MPKTYNKLVRDKIPAIIEAAGDTSVTYILNEETYLIALVDKLKEEVAEYAADPNTEELVDILEIVLALAADRFHITPVQLEEIRLQKYAERGGFSERLFLVETN